jgi:hypothetical protein
VAKHLALMLSQPAGEKYGRLTLSNLNAGARPQAPQAAAPDAPQQPQQGNGHAGTHAAPAAERKSLSTIYEEATDYVLSRIVPKYVASGLGCTDTAAAAMVATIVIQRCKEER